MVRTVGRREGVRKLTVASALPSKLPDHIDFDS